MCGPRPAPILASLSPHGPPALSVTPLLSWSLPPPVRWALWAPDRPRTDFYWAVWAVASGRASQNRLWFGRRSGSDRRGRGRRVSARWSLPAGRDSSSWPSGRGPETVSGALSGDAPQSGLPCAGRAPSPVQRVPEPPNGQRSHVPRQGSAQASVGPGVCGARGQQDTQGQLCPVPSACALPGPASGRS